MNSEDYTEQCPLCDAPARIGPMAQRDASTIQCTNCGWYHATRTFLSTVLEHKKLDPIESTKLSFFVRRLQAPVEDYVAGKTATYHVPELDADNYREIIDTTTLPRPAEQMDMIIRWIGDHLLSPGHSIVFEQNINRAQFGAMNVETFKFLLQGLDEKKLIKTSGAIRGKCTCQFTIDGWQRYGEIERASHESNSVFMAMGYGSPVADEAYSAFQDAAEETGFHLWRLDERPEAGLIDARMVVGIRDAKFLVADLTGHNHGAYWEAGMAHGMGKHVIYTCEKSEWEKVHFDTSHYQAVIWEEDNLEEAAEKFKAAIRATFPFDAKMA